MRPTDCMLRREEHVIRWGRAATVNVTPSVKLMSVRREARCLQEKDLLRVKLLSTLDQMGLGVMMRTMTEGWTNWSLMIRDRSNSLTSRMLC